MDLDLDVMLCPMYDRNLYICRCIGVKTCRIKCIGAVIPIRERFDQNDREPFSTPILAHVISGFLGGKVVQERFQ